MVCHGKLDNGTDREVDGDTLFGIGSITKVFTALLLQDMVARGEMKLEDPVQNYLSDSVRVPTYQGKEITLLHLATHTSGLPRDRDRDAYAALSRCTLKRAPGTHEEYSNFGMALLGHAIALKTGKDYETLVVERICKPLGMDSTRVNPSPELTARIAVGHAMPGSRVRTSFSSSAFPGDGGLYSTANDLLKFVSAYSLLTPSPLADVMRKAQALYPLESGAKRRMAWEGNGSVFAHGGLTDGYETQLAFDVEKRRGIVVLSSCANWSTLVSTIWQPLLNGRYPKPIDGVSVDPAIYDGYVGQYRTDKHSGIVTVRREGTRLLLQYRDRLGDRYVPSLEVFPISRFEFCNEFWGWGATFTPLKKGRSPQLTTRSLVGRERFELTKFSTEVPQRPQPVLPDSNAYRAYAGQYRKTFLFGLLRFGPTLSISHKTDELGDHLIASVRGVPGYGAAEFFPVSQTRFVVDPTTAPEDVRLEFLRNRKGKATQVDVYWNGRSLRGSRIPDKLPSNPKLSGNP